MSEDKENPIVTLWHSFRKGKNETREEATVDFGLDFMKTDTFDRRLTSQTKFNEYIKETVNPKKVEADKLKDNNYKIEFYRERTIEINAMLMSDSIPFGIGGETVWYNKVAFAWSVIYTWTLAIIDSVDWLINQGEQTSKKLEEKKEELNKTVPNTG